MTHDYKAALNAMRRAFERTNFGLDSWLHGIGAVVADHRQEHLSALQLAHEAEQLRKERDELMAHSHKIERLQKAYVKLYEAAHSWQDPSKLDHALDNDELAEEYNKAKKVSAENGE